MTSVYINLIFKHIDVYQYANTFLVSQKSGLNCKGGGNSSGRVLLMERLFWWIGSAFEMVISHPIFELFGWEWLTNSRKKKFKRQFVIQTELGLGMY